MATKGAGCESARAGGRGFSNASFADLITNPTGIEGWGAGGGRAFLSSCPNACHIKPVSYCEGMPANGQGPAARAGWMLHRYLLSRCWYVFNTYHQYIPPIHTTIPANTGCSTDIFASTQRCSQPSWRSRVLLLNPAACLCRRISSRPHPSPGAC